MKNFARIAAPLNKKLHKDEPKVFGALSEEEFEAFATLRESLLKPPILALPKVGKHYILETDACNEQVGCILLQEQETAKDYRPIGYWSRTLNTAERNYTTTERECLAIVWGILILRPYLEGTNFTVRTDHDSLRWLLNITDVSGRLARWRLRLAEFDYSVVNRPGVKHQAPDALSRLLTSGDDQSPLDDDIPCFITDTDSNEEELDHRMEDDYSLTEEEVLALREVAQAVEPISTPEFLQEQAKDSYCKSLLPETTVDASHFITDQFGIICRKSTLDGALQRVVPESLRERVLYLSHYPILAGHPGGYKLYATLRRDYYWPFMANDAYEFVRKCKSCVKVRGTTRKHSRKLKLFPAQGPLDFVAMDFLGPLPRTKTGNQHVLVITDRFTKLCRAIPLKNTKAVTTAKAFLESWIYVYGPPRLLLTDNGRSFTSKFFQSICLAVGTKNLFTTAYHPQSNGQAERYNRTLVTRLRHFVAEHQDNWDDYVQPLTYAYNMQVHAATGTTPFDLVLSRHPPAITLETPAHPDPHTPAPSAASVKAVNFQKWRTILAAARSRMTAAQQRYKDNFNAKVASIPHFVPGDYVILNKPPLTAARDDNTDTTPQSYNKLQLPTTEPYPVLHVQGHTLVIEIQGIPITVAIDRCSKYPTDGIVQPETQSATPPAIPPPEENYPALEPEDLPEPEYVVDSVVDSRREETGTSYRVRWYGYGPQADTWPSSAIPNHFIVAFERRQQRKRARSSRN